VGIFAGLLAAKLYLIDWPTVLFARRWRGMPPLQIQAGWLPLLIALCFLTTFLSDAPVFEWGAAVLGTAACLWAIYASGPLPSVIQSRQILLANSHIATAVVVNAVLAFWWTLAAVELTSPTAPAPFGTMSVGALALMAGSGFGVRVLGVVWVSRFTALQRKWITSGLAAAAVAVAAIVWFGAAHPALRPLLVVLVVTFIVVHRIACVNFNATQLRVRAVLLVVAAMVCTAVAHKSDGDLSAPVIQLGAAALLGVAVASLGMALYNQRERGY
jgi:hypothetical protein